MSLTIVMYHFVRELPLTRYPAIKGLKTSEFVQQLDFLGDHYEFVTAGRLLEALAGGPALPDNAVLLTFDDGYADHFHTVFPILDARRIQGCFFPPAKAICENQVLDVNKIHFILAAAKELPTLLADVFAALDDFRGEFGLLPNSAYFEKLAVANRFDGKEIIFIKRLLQRELAAEVRRRITDRLFARYVGVSEAAFSRELYMRVEQLRCMIRHGMYVGSHGHGHDWLDTLAAAEQERDVDLSLNFLHEIGAPTDPWIMCYPYGAHDESLIEILRRRGCRAALTTQVGVAEVSAQGAMRLARFDTNDLPKNFAKRAR